MKRTSRICATVLLAAGLAAAPEASSGQPEETEGKRVFGIIPNFRAAPSLDNFNPLTAGQKFKVASDDALHRGTFAVPVG
jgi:hypothetical protein